MNHTTRNGVLITGGSGFLGHALVEQLFKDGCERICIYSRNEYSQATMRARFNDDRRLRWFIGDVRDQDRLESAMASVESVIHAAALKRIEVGDYCPDELIKTNVTGSSNVITAARRAQVDKVLLVSSDKAFQPISPYGQSKALAESLFLKSNTGSGPKFAVVRYGNVWNSTGSILPTWKRLLHSSDTVPVTDPSATRFFMWREEAALLVIDTMATMQGGEIAIPDLPAYRVGDLASALGAKMDVKGMKPLEKMHEAMDEKRSSDRVRRMTVEELRQAVRRA